MIKITKNIGNKVSYKLHLTGGTNENLTPKELEQLFKKVGKILNKDGECCPYCYADLK